MTREILRILSLAVVLDAIGVIGVIGVSLSSSEEEEEEHSVVPCPSFCACDTWYDLRRVSCTGRHIYSIHTGAPSGVQALDLSNNSISALKDHELTEVGLSKLKYLNLSVNAISEIGLIAFEGLSELTVLDLSQNHLYYLLSDVFVPTRSLRILRLSRNNFNSHIPKLNCPWLTELTLDSCQITHVPVDTFIGLSHLRKLDLSDNSIIQLGSVTLQALHLLREISIEGNPWSCNKLTHDLQTYLTYKNIDYQAVCGKTSGPKKFEKMIVYNSQIRHERPSAVSKGNVKRKNAITTTKKNLAPTWVDNNTNICDANATEETDIAKTLNAISPFWFFTTGFLLGSALSTFVCYVWLMWGMSCRRGYREQRGNDIQRISLLQNLWQNEDPAIFDENAHRTASSCPGTPPPPYREVMLRPGLYRNPSIMVN